MSPVKIVGNSSALSQGTKVFTESGVEIPGVTSIDISLRPDSIVMAMIGIATNFDELVAMPEFSFDSVVGMALAHGYKLVPLDENCGAE